MLFSSQSDDDDDEIPKIFDVSELFKYLSIEKRWLLLSPKLQYINNQSICIGGG